MTPKVPAKHAGGRPLLFKSPEELQEKIEEYFEWCDNRTRTVYSEKTGEIMITSPAPYTMSGLARRMGIDRKTLLNYAEKDKFFHTIRDARQRVEEDVENRLLETKNEKGAMFSLTNNFGWQKDAQTLIQVNAQDMQLNFASDDSQITQRTT